MARKPRKVRTEEEIFLDKLKKMEKFKQETDEKLIELGKQFFKEYNSLDYDIVHKRMEEKYKSSPFERRKFLTEEQEKMLYEKFDTTDLEKVMEQIESLDLTVTAPSEDGKVELSDEDKDELVMLKELKEMHGTSDISFILQKYHEDIRNDLEKEYEQDRESINYMKDIAKELKEKDFYPYKDLFAEIKKRF